MARDSGKNVASPVILRKIGNELMMGKKTDYAMIDGHLYHITNYDPEKVEDTPNPLLKAAEDRKKLRDDKKDVQPMVEEELVHDGSYFVPKTPIYTEEWGFYTGEKNIDWDSAIDEFDEGIKGLTDRRGDIYGHPQDDFDRIIQIQKALDDCDDEFARHIMNMIAVKMSRLVKTPDHSDSWIDIVGYVRTWFMIQEKRKENE